jgi:hypothetical protein
MSKIGSNSARQPGWHRLATVDIQIADLAPFPDHARRHSATQIRALARSIDALNYNVPIIIDEQNRILVGHAPKSAIRKIKFGLARTGSLIAGCGRSLASISSTVGRAFEMAYVDPYTPPQNRGE